MSTCEIALIQQSFRKLSPLADHAAALFYARLFELDPSLRCLCRGDMEQQGRRLLRLLGSAIGSLDRLENLRPAICRLGLRRAHQGTRDEHYAASGTALLWALEKTLGPEFTTPVKAAWTHFYVMLANAMLDGAHRHEVAA